VILYLFRIQNRKGEEGYIMVTHEQEKLAKYDVILYLFRIQNRKGEEGEEGRTPHKARDIERVER
jgi:hypothetical protein